MSNKIKKTLKQRYEPAKDFKGKCMYVEYR